MMGFLGDSLAEESLNERARNEAQNAKLRKDANQPGPAQGFLLYPI
jgi:hypothetical protein